MADRTYGKVKFFNATKGFGFITTPDGDVFFHQKALPHDVSTIANGTSVSFVKVIEAKGPRASDLKIV